MHTSINKRRAERGARKGPWFAFRPRGVPCGIPHSPLCLALALLLGIWAVPDAAAQALPLEIRQNTIRYNLSSTNGLPLSTVRGTPPGSDGRGPTLAQQQAAGLTETVAALHTMRSVL